MSVRKLGTKSQPFPRKRPPIRITRSRARPFSVDSQELRWWFGRPVQGAAEANITLFKLEPDGKHAVRVAVKLGRTSVNDIEIREGLNPGDRVILSDMSAQDEFDRVRLN